MKRALKIFPIAILIASSGFSVSAQIPQYELCVRNIRHTSINYPNDAIVFDIYLRNTNPSVVFEYAGGIYIHNFDTSIFNPLPAYPPLINDTSFISYKLLASDLPPELLLRNPSFGMAEVPILRTALNTFPETGGGFIISTKYPGTLIARMRIWNKLSSMNNVPLNLSWRNPPAILSTRIYAFAGNTIIEITASNTHCIDTTLMHVNTENKKPEKFILHQNYPNPFNPVTKISYELRSATGRPGYVSLKIYDVTGKLVTVLLSQKQNVGYYTIEWDAGGFGSGVYIYQLEAEGYRESRRMVVVR